MSATINAKKIKFHVLGNGFDNVRNDSGKGLPAPDYHDLSGMTLACIDQTNTYVWLTDSGNYMFKIKLDTWEFQSNSIPIGAIYHPSNVENNYGIVLIGGNRTVVFDLTSGSIIKDITASHSWISDVCDAILVDNDIYLLKCYPQNVDTALIHISLDDDSVSQSVIYNNCTCGFVDENTVYSYWSKVWFSQNSRANGKSFNDAVQWSTSEDVNNNRTFSAKLHGLCGNGKIYLPTPKNGVWTLGVYDGNSAPDLVTPTPIKTIGTFPSAPDFQWSYPNVNYCYNQGKTKACFATSVGTFYTDFKTIEKLEDNPSNMRPLAMNDRLIVSRRGNNQISVTYI